jgi:transposase InsO family protein
MGRRGNRFDNAKAESFIKTLKIEEVSRSSGRGFAYSLLRPRLAAMPLLFGEQFPLPEGRGGLPPPSCWSAAHCGFWLRYDPEGLDEARKLLDGVTWCEGAYEAMEDADALVIITEWNAFRSSNTSHRSLLSTRLKVSKKH